MAHIRARVRLVESTDGTQFLEVVELHRTGYRGRPGLLQIPQDLPRTGDEAAVREAIADAFREARDDVFIEELDAYESPATAEGLDGFDDEDESGDAPVEIPRDVRNLRTQAYDKGIGDLVRMIDDQSLILEPEYQRKYVWDTTRASLLVESILLSIPIPVIYVYEEGEGEWVVVDGLQRLHSLHRFVKGRFKLRNLEVLTELNTQSFDELNAKAQRLIQNGNLRVIVVLKESHPEIKYDIFQRLNRGAVRLSEQELRNCMYRGRLNELVRSISKNATFAAMIGPGGRVDRMQAEELALRFLAIESDFSRATLAMTTYSGRMKTFLNQFMHNNKQASAARVAELRALFESAVDRSHSVFGDSAFRRSAQEGRTNRALMDVVLVGLARADAAEVTAKAVQIRDSLVELIDGDDQFKRSILLGTSQKTALEYRLKAWTQKLRRLLVSPW